MIRLRVGTPDGRSNERVLGGEEVVVGRSSRCDLPVADRSISRRHARFLLRDEGWFVEDLESRNGTMIDGVRTDGPTRVRVGDVVQLGGTNIELVSWESSGSMSSATDELGGHTVMRSAHELLDRKPTGATDHDALRRYADRLQLLTAVHRALDTSIELDELLELILDRTFEHLRPEQGAVVLKQPDGGWSCAASRSLRGGDSSWLYSRHLVERVVGEGQAALVLDASDDERFREAASLLQAGVRSLVAAPLLDPDGALGMIVVGSGSASRVFTEDDMELLASVASVAAMRIRNVHLAEEAAERRRLDREVALARKIQKAILPERLPEVEGWQLFADNRPSQVVSGDFFKVLMRGPDELVILLADVSGKGMGAALLTGALEALSAAPIASGADPGEVCQLVSRLLFERTPVEKYATLFLVVVDVATGQVRYANAGHNPALIVRRGNHTEWLRSTGTPVGLIPDGPCSQDEVLLESGDLLVLYTDGITEAENPDGEEYGTERLRSAILRGPRRPLDELVAALGEDVDEFTGRAPLTDDRTVVALRRSG